MLYSLVTYPDPRLKIDHSEPIKFFDYRSSLDLAFTIMASTMKENDGIGIAGVQVGILLPICIVEDLYIVNPKVVSMSLDYDEIYEGCLSCDKKERIPIKRPTSIKVDYIDYLTANKVKNKELKGIQARCFLHEVDHIRGKLIKDYSAN